MNHCIWEAAQNNDAHAIPILVVDGVDIDLPNAQGQTALVIAVEAGHIAVASQLLLRYADINVTDRKGNTLLHRAIRRGDLATAIFLVERGADITRFDNYGNDAATLARSLGHEKLHRYLLRRDALPINRRNDMRKVSARIGQSAPITREEVLDLILAGAVINGTFQGEHHMPLLVAARARRADAVEALLSLGAHPRIRANFLNQKDQHNPAERAKYYGALDLDTNEETRKVLRRYGTQTLADFHREQLIAAAYFGDTRWAETMVQTLVYLDENPFVLTEDGKNAVHHAARFGQTDVLHLLYALGGPLDQPDRKGWSPAMWAIAGHHLEALAGLITSGAELNMLGPDGETALLLAAAQGDREALALLISAGADLEQANDSGATPLMVAVEQGDLVNVKALLDAGARPNAENLSGDTALQLAVFKDRPKLAEALLKAGADPNLRSGNGLPPLILAADYNRRDVAVILLDAGAHHHMRDLQGRTALMRAAARGSKHMIQLLLERGADPDAEDLAGVNALMQAATHNRGKILDLLMSSNRALVLDEQAGQVRLADDPRLEQEQRNRVLRMLADGILFNQRQVVDAVLASGLDINTPLSNGWSAVMWAAVADRPEMLRYLIERGGNVMARTPGSQNTAMHLVAMKGLLVSMKTLEEHGGDINALSASGHTPLTQAVIGGHERMVKWLIRHKARRTAHRFNESLPAIAAAAGNLDMLKTLEKQGLKIDEPNGHGWTPLIHAARNNHSSVLQWLLRKGAQPNDHTSDGTTPLMFAARNGSPTCVRALLEAGARTDLMDNNKTTALGMAQKEGHQQIVSLLTQAL